MKLLIWALLSSISFGAIARVNSTTGTATGGATTIAATAASHTAGNFLVVWVGQLNGGGGLQNVSSIANTAGDTFTSDATCKVSNGTTDRGEMWWAHNSNGNASDTVTATFAGSVDFRYIVVVQYSGVPTSGAFDVCKTASSFQANPVTTAAFTPAASGEAVFIGGTEDGGGSTWGTSGSYTAFVTNLGTTTGFAENLSAGSGSQTAVIACTSCNLQVAVALVIKAVVYTLTQSHFRWRNDDGSESAATWAAAEDTALSADRAINKRLRFSLATTSDAPSITFQLEAKKSTDTIYEIVPTAAPALPTWQAAGTLAGGTGAVSPAWPTHQTNDIGLLVCETAGGEAASLTTASGFASVTNSPQATGAGTAGSQLTVWWARATSSGMAAPTVGDAGDHTICSIVTFRGVRANGNPWDTTAGGVKAGASTTTTWDAVTTANNNELIVNIATRDNDSAAAAWSAQANASLGSVTERVDTGSTSGNGGGYTVTTGTLATAGNSGATTATVTSTVDGHMTIALVPPSPILLMSASANITAGGAQATTAQLTGPGGSFTAGVISDDTNPSGTVDIGSGNYTELEYSIQFSSAATYTDVYNFRITANGTALDTYSVTPNYTLSGGTAYTASTSETFFFINSQVGLGDHFAAVTTLLSSINSGSGFSAHIAAPSDVTLFIATTSGLGAHFASIAESNGVSNSQSRVAALYAMPVESIYARESPSRGLAASLVDTVMITDSRSGLGAHFAAPSENAIFANTSGGLGAHFASTSEFSTLLGIATGLAATPGSDVSEVLRFFDSVVVVATHFAAVSESRQVSESQARGLLTNVREPILLASSVGGSAAHIASPSESLYSSVSSGLASTFLRGTSELMAHLDSGIRTFGVQMYSVAVSERFLATQPARGLWLAYGPAGITRLLQGLALEGQGITWATSTWVPGVGGSPCTFTAASVVICTHNLKSTAVDVAAYDSTGVLIRPAKITRTSTTVVTVTFDGPETGYLVVK